MRLFAILAATTAIVASSPALAQTGPAEPTSVQPADPARLQLARELLEVSGGQQSAQGAIKAIFGTVYKLLDQTLPAEKADTVKLVENDLQDELVKMIPQIWDISIQAYARNLTEQQLRDYIAWLRSDSGRAVVAKTPAMRQEILDAELPLMKTMLPGLMQKAVDRACDQARCTPQDRQTIAQTVGRAMGSAPS